MFRNFKILVFTFYIVFAAAAFANAQGADASSRSGAPSKEDLPKGIQESLAKQRITRERKDFDEMIENSEEALKISVELEKSFVKNSGFSVEDQKKLERLEKVVKKIRSEMGGDSDDEAEEKPSSVADALQTLKTGTNNLVSEIKKTSRYSVSVVAVQSSNALLKVVRFLRFRRN